MWIFMQSCKWQKKSCIYNEIKKKNKLKKKTFSSFAMCKRKKKEVNWTAHSFTEQRHEQKVGIKRCIREAWCFQCVHCTHCAYANEVTTACCDNITYACCMLVRCTTVCTLWAMLNSKPNTTIRSNVLIYWMEFLAISQKMILNLPQEIFSMNNIVWVDYQCNFKIIA